MTGGIRVDVRPEAIFDAAGLRNAFGLRRRSVALAIKAGKLRGHKTSGKWWFSGADVRRWLLGEDANGN